MLQNLIFKVCKCFDIFYTLFSQVKDKIEIFEFPRNAQCLLPAIYIDIISQIYFL